MKSLINNVNRKLGRKSKKGFSLVELLVVIAVIGVIAAIAIPAMSNVFENSRQAKAKRNAQNLASTYSAARAAGAVFTAVDVPGIVAELTDKTALKTGAGQFKDSTFFVNIDDAEATEAAKSLEIVDNQLSYTGTGGDLGNP